LKLLDLFCGAGGAGEGYRLAGFEVTGVDIVSQPSNPHDFIQADALDCLESSFHKYDAIHASPPCQAYSRLKALTKKAHPKLIVKVRKLLKATGKPYIIENVIGAPLCSRSDIFGNHGVILCGSMFGLGVWRHRVFETSFPVPQPVHRHDLVPLPVDVSGTGGPRKGARLSSGGGDSRKPRSIAEAQEVMGINWMIRREINQAVPPRYTEYLAKYLIESIEH
jgi:DNA (cytosine-5)-methyltransferase 1